MKLPLAVSMIVFGVASASAADLPRTYAAAPAIREPIYSWVGAYVGIEGGGSWGRSKHVDRLTGLDDTPRFDVNGGLLGGTAGYNWQVTNWVLGVEADVSWSGQKGSSLDSGPAGNLDFSSFTNVEWLGTVRGRVGYAPNNFLFYATAGYAAAGVEAGVKSSATGLVFDRATNTRSGWTAGAGAEWALAPACSIKIEYLYVKLEDTGFPTPNVGAAFDRSRVPLEDNIVRVGLNYHFSGLSARRN